ncbi:hypothetical protein CL614_06665 [archaeon]|nr:hypothetical protein [archaeon]
MGNSRNSFKFKSSGIHMEDANLQTDIDFTPVGIVTPVELGGNDRSGLFRMNMNPADQIADNLRNLILTNAGERLGNYAYGANLKPLMTEYSSQESFDAQAMIRIKSAVEIFIPQIDLDEFSSSVVPLNDAMTRIDMTVRYNIPSLRVQGRALSVSMYVI